MTTFLSEGALERVWAPLAAVLALAIVWSIASAVWFFIGGAETDVAPAASNTARAESATPERTGLSASDIAALNLFGAPIASDDRSRIADAPETRLQLELKGVFLADDPDRSSVIVAERNRDGRLYRVGDRLPGNAELVEVLGDRIVLRRAGRLETLKFPDALPGNAFAVEGEAAPARSAAAGGGAVRTGFDNADPAPATGRGVATTSPGSDELPRSEGDTLRDRIRDFGERLNVDPDGTLAELGVEPVSPGASGGYRLGGEIPASTLAQVGLRPGDVVLSVNGRAVGDVQQDRSQLDAIVDAGSARLEIQRGERRFFVTTRIR